MAGEDYPLRSVCTSWQQRIKRALDFKKVEFQRYADEAMKFYRGSQAAMWGDDGIKGITGFMGQDARFDPPQYRMTVNRVAELVQLMGPKLYPSDPYRSVTPRSQVILSPDAWGDPNDVYVQGMYQQMMAQEQARMDALQNGSQCLAAALNYTPNELDLVQHSRRVIEDALIKGMGCWWTEYYNPHRMAHKLVGSFWDSADNVVFDPDAECYEEMTWIARRRRHPYWEVEMRFNLRPGCLMGKGHYESANAQGDAISHPDARYKRNTGREARDIIEYWEIYSKCGFGDRLSGVKPSVADDIAVFGDFCFIAVAAGVPYPLNMPNYLLETENEEEIFDASQWPIPYWADNAWPMTPLWFHNDPNSIYPVSHVRAGMAELKFLSWAMSFLATKIRAACHTLVGVRKSAADDVKENLFNSDMGYAVIPIEEATGKSLKDIIEIFDAPEFNPEIWKIVSAVNEQLEKRLGLSEILYGQTATQSRSASDAQSKQQNASIRMEDMYTKTVRQLTLLARNEAMAARWGYTQLDLQNIIGDQGAAYWMQSLVPNSLESLVREYDMRIEAGNAREPSKEVRVDQMNQSVQVWGPLLTQWAMHTGNPNPINALMEDWADANDITGVQRYALPPAMPPPPPGAPQPGQPGREHGQSQGSAQQAPPKKTGRNNVGPASVKAQMRNNPPRRGK